MRLVKNLSVAQSALSGAVFSGTLLPVLLLLASLLFHGTASANTDDEVEVQPAETVTRPDHLVYRIRPSDTDPGIHRFDEPHLVVFRRGTSAQAQLVVFMPGTHGKPANSGRLLSVIADQGYRVIGLEYNDEPAVVQTCPRDLSPRCSGDFRRKRIFGDVATSIVDNTPAETIVNRLVKLLEYLDREHSGDGWGAYLTGGVPDWNRIVVSGLSQGAGMAAYIAKSKSVARVVLFSSPWDFTGRSKTLAPWLADPSATPPDRWFAEYHKRENTAALLAQAYVVLRIPPANIRVFDLGLAGRSHGDNPFHGSTVRNPGYEPQWRFLFGQSP